MKRFFALLMLFVGLFVVQMPAVSATTSLLPDFTGGTDLKCDKEDESWKEFLYLVEATPNQDIGFGVSFNDLVKELGVDNVFIRDFFACAVQTGYVKFWMVPYFVTYALQFLVSLAGLLAVLFVMIGAYYYIAGGLNEDKEKGKTIITYAIGGFVLVTLAWVIVNAILLILTTN